MHLELERAESGSTVVAASDGGRVATFGDGPAGPTTLEILDLPALPGELPAVPRLWIAAAGASPSWRRAGVEVSADAGASFATLGTTTGAATMGRTRSVLLAGPLDCWDRHSAVDVELLSDAMWLEGRSEASVLAGANMALIGSEVVQFAGVETLAPRQFRLSGLLRGRLGTESAVPSHAGDERFVLLDRSILLPFDPPADAIGRAYRFRAAGPGDLASETSEIVATARALKPLSPAHLLLKAAGGDVVARWVRRSRGGFGWPDFVDAAVAEASEAYRVDISLDGRAVRSVAVATPMLVYSAGDRAADGGGMVVGFAAAQLSAAVGPGAFATAVLNIES